MAADIVVMLNLYPKISLSGAALDSRLRNYICQTFDRVRGRYGSSIVTQQASIALNDQAVIIKWTVANESLVQEIGSYTKNVWEDITAGVGHADKERNAPSRETGDSKQDPNRIVAEPKTSPMPPENLEQAWKLRAAMDAKTRLAEEQAALRMPIVRNRRKQEHKCTECGQALSTLLRLLGRTKHADCNKFRE